MKPCRLLYGCAVLLLWCNLGMAEPLSGGGAQWYPYSFEDAAGQPRGIAVDIVRKALERNGQQIVFMFYPANRLNLQLDDGHLDLNYADSPLWNPADASDRFVYSRPYLQVREYLYFRHDHPARALPLSKLQGLRIGVVRGYTYPSLDGALQEGRLIKVQTSQESALLDLLVLDRVDAIAVVDDVFSDLLAARQLQAGQFARGAKLSDAPLVIKLQRRHAGHLPGLNATLKAMIGSGEVERIRRSYLPARPGDSDRRSATR